MGQDIPTSLDIYLKLTNSLYTTITTQSEHIIDEAQLEAWCSKLCLLLSQYTIHNGQADTRSIYNFKKFCPWRMSAEDTSRSQLLAELCLSNSCCHSLNDYKLIEQESEADETIKSYLLSSSDKYIPTNESLFISVFWFLMERKHLLEYIEILALSDVQQSKVIWGALIDCMISKLYYFPSNLYLNIQISLFYIHYHNSQQISYWGMEEVSVFFIFLRAEDFDNYRGR